MMRSIPKIWFMCDNIEEEIKFNFSPLLGFNIKGLFLYSLIVKPLIILLKKLYYAF